MQYIYTALLIKQPPLYVDIQPHRFYCDQVPLYTCFCTLFVVVHKQVQYMYNIIVVIM